MSVRISDLSRIRVEQPDRIATAAAVRRRPDSLLAEHGHLMVIAADHPARGMVRAGTAAPAMSDRGELLARLVLALEHPGVNGVLGTPDIIEDLLLLGALEGKVVIGSMNRGGLQGTVFELDDRFTAYTASALAAMGYEGGKMLLRIDDDDPATGPTLAACGRAVSALAGRGLMAMIEPFASHRVAGQVRNELTADAMARAISVAAGLGETSARTWLKVPIVADMERAVAATTLPCVVLGGEVGADPDAVFASWGRALEIANVVGLVVGRSLLFPHDDDVASAVTRAVALLAEAKPTSVL